jgi:hypothetical protein
MVESGFAAVESSRAAVEKFNQLRVTSYKLRVTRWFKVERFKV